MIPGTNRSWAWRRGDGERVKPFVGRYVSGATYGWYVTRNGRVTAMFHDWRDAIWSIEFDDWVMQQTVCDEESDNDLF